MLTQEELAKLKADHADIWHIIGKNDAWEIVFKKPSRPQYKMFRANNQNPARKADAQEILLRECIVFPLRERFDELLNKYPAIPEAEAVSEALVEAMGLEGELAEKS
jgi:hypothetical protein